MHKKPWDESWRDLGQSHQEDTLAPGWRAEAVQTAELTANVPLPLVGCVTLDKWLILQTTCSASVNSTVLGSPGLKWPMETRTKLVGASLIALGMRDPRCVCHGALSARTWNWSAASPSAPYALRWHLDTGEKDEDSWWEPAAFESASNTPLHSFKNWQYMDTQQVACQIWGPEDWEQATRTQPLPLYGETGAEWGPARGATCTRSVDMWGVPSMQALS